MSGASDAPVAKIQPTCRGGDCTIGRRPIAYAARRPLRDCTRGYLPAEVQGSGRPSLKHTLAAQKSVS